MNDMATDGSTGDDGAGLRPLAMWPLAGFNVLLALVFAALLGAATLAEGPLHFELTSRIPVIPLVFVATATGILILRRYPRHTVGWLLLTLACLAGLETSTITYSYIDLVVRDGALPGGDMAAWVNWVLVLIGLAGLLPAIPLLFPDGRLPSSRWRPLLWSMGVSLLVAVPSTVLVESFPFVPWATNPLWVTVAPSVATFSYLALALLAAANWIGAGASVVARYRAADEVGRRQVKWFLLGTSVMVVMHGLILLTETPLISAAVSEFLYGLTVLGPTTALLAVMTIGVAILRHRLYDIDLVISKTLVYGALAVFIGAVYVGVVVGMGHLVGTGGEPNTALAILATTLIAVAFQPVRERLEHRANRFVYGNRTTPLQAVSRFSESMSLGDTGQTLDEMTRVVAGATGATTVEVWHRSGHDLEVTAAHPPGTNPTRLPLSGGRLPTFPDRDTVVPIHHREELLGAITITKPPGDPLTVTEHRLVRDLADQAGLVLRNRILTEELRARVRQVEEQTAELTRSRADIVAAHDTERRRLERNIHDGAQQHLVALAVKLGLARTLALRDPAKAESMVQTIAQDLAHAEDTIDQLAHGLHPNTLTREGIASALAADLVNSPIPVDIRDMTTRRHPPDIEATAYFACLEAVQNAIKHSGADTITVHVGDDGESVGFAITDDGKGFDPRATPRGTGLQSLMDRIATAGGDVAIRSTPGNGTRIEGHIPAVTPTRV